MFVLDRGSSDSMIGLRELVVRGREGRKLKDGMIEFEREGPRREEIRDIEDVRGFC
jgi:hypothetical protein